MLNDTPTSKVQRLLLFGILPLFYIWLSLSFQHRVQAFYLRNTDPIYAYLINGTNLASGNIESGLYQHPGMPMQYFIGVVVFIKHLFTGQGPVYQDVILHPESYLHVICITLTLLLALVTFFTGTYVFRHTGKLGLSLFFQFTPLITMNVFLMEPCPYQNLL